MIEITTLNSEVAQIVKQATAYNLSISVLPLLAPTHSRIRVFGQEAQLKEFKSRMA